MSTILTQYGFQLLLTHREQKAVQTSADRRKPQNAKPHRVFTVFYFLYIAMFAHNYMHHVHIYIYQSYARPTAQTPKIMGSWRLMAECHRYISFTKSPSDWRVRIVGCGQREVKKNSSSKWRNWPRLICDLWLGICEATYYMGKISCVKPIIKY